MGCDDGMTASHRGCCVFQTAVEKEVGCLADLSSVFPRLLLGQLEILIDSLRFCPQQLLLAGYSTFATYVGLALSHQIVVEHHQAYAHYH